MTEMCHRKYWRPKKRKCVKQKFEVLKAVNAWYKKMETPVKNSVIENIEDWKDENALDAKVET